LRFLLQVQRAPSAFFIPDYDPVIFVHIPNRIAGTGDYLQSVHIQLTAMTPENRFEQVFTRMIDDRVSSLEQTYQSGEMDSKMTKKLHGEHWTPSA